MHIQEMDRVAALGLKHLEAIITAPDSGEPVGEVVREAAGTAAKLFNAATRRMSAISNKVSVAAKVAKLAGMSGDQLLPIYQEIAPAQNITGQGLSQKGKKGA